MSGREQGLLQGDIVFSHLIPSEKIMLSIMRCCFPREVIHCVYVNFEKLRIEIVYTTEFRTNT